MDDRILLIPEDSLRHHGIPGQKWGKRNGPPYPLSTSKHNRVISGKPDSKNQERSIDERRHDHTEKAPHPSVGKIIFDIALIRPVNLALDIKALSDNSAAKRKVKKVLKTIGDAPVEKATGVKRKTKEYSIEEDAKMINPEFKNFYMDTKKNCVLCSLTYDLRRRGYEVTAQKVSLGYTPPEIVKFYKNSKGKTLELNKDYEFYTVPKNDNIKHSVNSKLLEQGDGARGMLALIWDHHGHPCGGHAIAYEISNGKVTYVDGQSGKVMKEIPDNTMRQFDIMRTDDKVPNWELMKKEVIRND